jgi:uncharacterized protein YggL (DUF469 family)
MAGSKDCESISTPMTCNERGEAAVCDLTSGCDKKAHLVDFIELGDDVESHFREIIPEELQEEIEEVLDGVFSAKNGCQTHDDRSESGYMGKIRKTY